MLERPDIHKDALVSHGIDLASLEQGGGNDDPAAAIDRFLKARVSRLKSMIYAAVGVNEPQADEPEAADPVAADWAARRRSPSEPAPGSAFLSERISTR